MELFCGTILIFNCGITLNLNSETMLNLNCGTILFLMQPFYPLKQRKPKVILMFDGRKKGALGINELI